MPEYIVEPADDNALGERRKTLPGFLEDKLGGEAKQVDVNGRDRRRGITERISLTCVDQRYRDVAEAVSGFMKTQGYHNLTGVNSHPIRFDGGESLPRQYAYINFFDGDGDEAHITITNQKINHL
ncbi:hypothetical protein CMI46_01970 [Candidatus Pacearchaeota archaeon]|nr:hypothetical protein [Candidatus Pacearchaeota archaeon]|tara:strand:+ start:2535 stop:2909 length:375 start_codon:yes stop_codon:yes gene_type:complete